MTDTAGLIKPLKWGRNHGYSHASVLIPWQQKVMQSPADGLEKSEQVKYEAEHIFNVLSALNLDAFKASIRAEALEEAAVYCETHAVERATRDGTFSAVQSPTTKYSTHQGSAYGPAIRALKEGE